MTIFEDDPYGPEPDLEEVRCLLCGATFERYFLDVHTDSECDGVGYEEIP